MNEKCDKCQNRMKQLQELLIDNKFNQKKLAKKNGNELALQKLQYEEEKIKLELNSLVDINSVYDNKFFSKRVAKTRIWEKRIGKEISERFKITSLVDFGCAIGSFLEGALEGGTKKICGYEYAYESAKPYINKNIADYIKYGNAGDIIDCGKFDCSMSIEVAEHIPEIFTFNFIDNLCNASDRLIILTAAIQDGKYHINLKPREFWISEISKRGFNYNQEFVNESIENWKKLVNIYPIKEIPSYIFTNLMIFEKGK